MSVLKIDKESCKPRWIIFFDSEDAMRKVQKQLVRLCLSPNQPCLVSCLPTKGVFYITVMPSVCQDWEAKFKPEFMEANHGHP